MTSQEEVTSLIARCHSALGINATTISTVSDGLCGDLNDAAANFGGMEEPAQNAVLAQLRAAAPILEALDMLRDNNSGQ